MHTHERKEVNKMTEQNCWTCAYKGKNPGSAHVRCRFKWTGSELAVPVGKPWGISHGWWIFPLNFDPVWMVEQCPAWSETVDQDKLAPKPDAMTEALAILASVGRFF